MGLFSRKKPKIKVTSTKKDSFSGWLKCTHCLELIHKNELDRNLSVCPKCQYHFRISLEERLAHLADVGSFSELFSDIAPNDPLQFVDTEPYAERLKNAQEKSQKKDAIVVGKAKIEGQPFFLGILDFNFMGGSMGSVVGEKLTLLIEQALQESLPLVIVSTSGGARMQEGCLSLMQMAKTSAALGRLKEKGIPYISLMVNPTTGGVTASFASLGDVILAEPQALVCFAGPRVIEQILGKPLPSGAQQSEALLKNGLIDAIVHRQELKKVISSIIRYGSHHLTKNV